MTCRPPEEMVEERINRVLTQYRESPKLLHMLRTYMGAVARTHELVCSLPDHFDLETAVGDQLTLLGKRMGWPRCHCICDIEPVFGFDCEGLDLRPLTGFCEPSSSWEECSTGLSELCITDDEVYRKFLKVRRYQMTNRFDLGSLEEAVRTFFGPTGTVIHHGQGRVVVAPGRDLSPGEVLLLQLYPRVLPTALGIRITFHFDKIRVFGFGDGWGGFLEDDPELTATTVAFQRTGKVFGFCDDPLLGGFCEVWSEDGLPLETEVVDEDGNPELIVDGDGEPLYTGPLTYYSSWMCRTSAPWMCEIDPHPYDCR